MVEKIVYFDSNYNTSWICPTIATMIQSFLKKRNFISLDAVQLSDFMYQFVDGQIKKAIIVFSMDKAPETILDSDDANGLVRKYLDAGGKIVWIGDKKIKKLITN